METKSLRKSKPTNNSVPDEHEHVHAAHCRHADEHANRGAWVDANTARYTLIEEHGHVPDPARVVQVLQKYGLTSAVVEGALIVSGFRKMRPALAETAASRVARALYAHAPPEPASIAPLVEPVVEPPAPSN